MLIRSKPFIPSKALELAYKRRLKALCKPMFKEVSETILRAYRADFATDGVDDIEKTVTELKGKYDRTFREKGKEEALKMVLKVLKFGQATFKLIMEKLLPKEHAFMITGSAISKELEEIIKASVFENVTLIKSIEDKYFEQVTGSVVRSMQSGGSIKQLKDEIMRYKDMTEKRAAFIALDQTRKTYMAITKQQLKEDGFTKVEWVHSGGGEPRPYHIQKWDGVSGKKDGRPNGLNGFIFDIDNPPVIEAAYEPKTARGTYRSERRGLPTELPNCKCTMCAVIEI